MDVGVSYTGISFSHVTAYSQTNLNTMFLSPSDSEDPAPGHIADREEAPIKQKIMM